MPSVSIPNPTRKIKKYLSRNPSSTSAVDVNLGENMNEINYNISRKLHEIDEGYQSDHPSIMENELGTIDDEKQKMNATSATRWLTFNRFRSKMNGFRLTQFSKFSVSTPKIKLPKIGLSSLGIGTRNKDSSDSDFGNINCNNGGDNTTDINNNNSLNLNMNSNQQQYALSENDMEKRDSVNFNIDMNVIDSRLTMSSRLKSRASERSTSTSEESTDDNLDGHFKRRRSFNQARYYKNKLKNRLNYRSSNNNNNSTSSGNGSNSNMSDSINTTNTTNRTNVGNTTNSNTNTINTINTTYTNMNSNTNRNMTNMTNTSSDSNVGGSFNIGSTNTPVLSYGASSVIAARQRRFHDKCNENISNNNRLANNNSNDSTNSTNDTNSVDNTISSTSSNGGNNCQSIHCSENDVEDDNVNEKECVLEQDTTHENANENGSEGNENENEKEKEKEKEKNVSDNKVNENECEDDDDDEILYDIEHDLELPENWYLKWPYNKFSHRNDSVRMVQTFYVLERWKHDMSLYVTRDLLSIIQNYVCKEQRYLCEYNIKAVIGKGTFATVFQVEEYTTGKILVLKAYQKQDLIDKNQKKHITAERKLFKYIKDENQRRLVCLKHRYQEYDYRKQLKASQKRQPVIKQKQHKQQNKQQNQQNQQKKYKRKKQRLRHNTTDNNDSDISNHSRHSSSTNGGRDSDHSDHSNESNDSNHSNNSNDSNHSNHSNQSNASNGSNNSSTSTNSLERQIDVNDLDNPFVVEAKYAFQDCCHLYYIFDYYSGGELFYHLKQKKNFHEDTAKFFAAQVALGIGFLHKFKFIWRSCKPEDILLDSKGYICISDFGLGTILTPQIEDENDNDNDNDKDKDNDDANGIDNGNENNDNENEISSEIENELPLYRTNSFCWAIPEYICPELLDNENNSWHSLPSDWWSFGCLIYELVIGVPPFWRQGASFTEIYEMIKTQPLTFPTHFMKKHNISGEFEDIVTKLLTREPNQRLGSENDIEDIKQHPWFNDICWKKLSWCFVVYVTGPLLVIDHSCLILLLIVDC